MASGLYGLGGAALLNRQLDLLLAGRRLVWTALDRVGRQMVHRKTPYRNEADLVGRIGYRELNYAGIPDGLPLDPAVAMREFAAYADEEVAPFEAEPFDLVAEMPKFTWPTVVVSGGQDLTTPPAVADRIAGLVPGAVLVRLPTMGHSALDTKEGAALRIAAVVTAGRPARCRRRRRRWTRCRRGRGAADGLGARRRGPASRRPCRGGAARARADRRPAGYFMKPIAL